jgi:predicted amidohydrolase
MRVAVVQTNPIFGEVKPNVRAALALMEGVGADLYVLPELFNTGYNFIDAEEVRKLSEEKSGFMFQSVREFAAGRSCYIVYGFAEKADRIYNSAALVGPTKNRMFSRIFPSACPAKKQKSQQNCWQFRSLR